MKLGCNKLVSRQPRVALAALFIEQDMTRVQERALWAVVLTAFGAQKVEQMISAHLSLMQRNGQFDEQLGLVSAEGMAELAGILLANIETGERPLLGSHRTMNRRTFVC